MRKRKEKSIVFGAIPIICTVLIWLCTYSLLSAQNSRSRKVPVQWPAQRIDSLSVSPSSFSLMTPSGFFPDSTWYRMTPDTLFWLKPADELPDSVTLFYRVLPFSFTHEFSTLYPEPETETPEGLLYVPDGFLDKTKDASLSESSLQYTGAFARSLSVGNNQDATLNSTLNIQLAGQIAENTRVEAVLSDANIPIQPDGTTAQINELDRVFFRITRPGQTLTLGDFEIQNPASSYFLRYYKKVQGAQLLQQIGSNHAAGTGFALSRGRFARQPLDLQDGNQGPYPLRGNNGEPFIIILAGTEKVYLDGVLLQRGENQDYVMDYNQGQIRFTPRRLITRLSRIIVEFEYAEQAFQRSLLTTQSNSKIGKWTLNTLLLSEQDGLSATAQGPLSEGQRVALQNSMSSTAQIPAIQPADAFDPTRVYYFLKDTLLPCGKVDSLLIYAAANTENRVITRFSFVGANQGNYQLDPAVIANERAYKWVAPDPFTCEPRGDYAPVQVISAPKRNSRMMIQASRADSLGNGLQWETAWSNDDVNRFSRAEPTLQSGLAFHVNWQQEYRARTRDSLAWKMVPRLEYDHTQRGFNALNPYKNAEFQRDWTLPVLTGRQEHWLRGGLTIQQAQKTQVTFGSQALLQAGNYQGFKQTLQGRVGLGNWKFLTNTSITTTEQGTTKGVFFRPQLEVQHQRKPGSALVTLRWEREDNLQRDSLRRFVPESFTIQQALFKIQTPEAKKGTASLQYHWREDKLPLLASDQLFVTAISHALSGEASYAPSKQWRFQTLGTWRLAANNGAKPLSNMVGRANISGAFFKGTIRSQTAYELGAGQEPRRTYTFIEVAKGEGTHVWLDSLFNRDGIIQPGEMELAPFPDQANFVKVLAASPFFLTTSNVQLSQSVSVDPKAIWYGSKDPVKRFFTRFSWQGALTQSQKTKNETNPTGFGNKKAIAFNPFGASLLDTNLIQSNGLFRSDVFFNRSNPVYDAQFTWLQTQTKYTNIDGAEGRGNTEFILRAGWNVAQKQRLEASISDVKQQSTAASYAQRNFSIDTRKGQLTYLFAPDPVFRIEIEANTQQSIAEGVESTRYGAGGEVNYARLQAFTAQATISYQQIAYEGDVRSPLAFTLLDGLRPGTNFLWSSTLAKTLRGGFRLQFRYEGRKTGNDARIIHTGSVQVGAVF